jgi:hypothetical protein
MDELTKGKVILGVLILTICVFVYTVEFRSSTPVPLVADPPKCQEILKRMDAVIDLQIATDSAVEKRQSAESESVINRLDASKVPPTQQAIILNNLTTKQDIENRALKNREENQFLALRLEMEQAGCKNIPAFGTDDDDKNNLPE